MAVHTLTGYFVIVIKLLITILLSGLIGYEREKIHRPAGLRTHIIVGIGALTLTLIALSSFPVDASRVIAGIVTGLGFLGAGTIFREHDIVKGLTTAASIWATAGVAIALALDNYFLAIIAAVSIYIILEMKNYPLFQRILFDPESENEFTSDDAEGSFLRANDFRSRNKRKVTKKRKSSKK